MRVRALFTAACAAMVAFLLFHAGRQPGAAADHRRDLGMYTPARPLPPLTVRTVPDASGAIPADLRPASSPASAADPAPSTEPAGMSSLTGKRWNPSYSERPAEEFTQPAPRPPLMAPPAPGAQGPAWRSKAPLEYPTADLYAAALAGHTSELIVKGESINLNTGAYGATLQPGGIQFSPPAPVPGVQPARLKMELQDVKVDGSTLASADPSVKPIVMPEERQIDYVRGPVTERYHLYDKAIEQMFIINDLPSGPGTIAVRVRVTTNGEVPADGTSSNLLVFKGIATGGAGSVDLETAGAVQIRGAVAYDAAGSVIRVALDWSGGVITMTLPPDWVAAATLPIVVDPTLDAGLLVDASTGETRGRIMDVEWNSVNSEWLVVWNEQVGASVFDWDLYARRISATGAAVGAAFPVENTTAASSGAVSLAYSAAVNRFFITWGEDPADNATHNDWAIYGRLLNGGSTTFFNAAAVLSDNPTGEDWNPTVVLAGTKFYLCHTTAVSHSNWDIVGSFWNTDMTSAGPADPDTTAGGWVEYPGAAYDAGSGKLLVAWESAPSIGLTRQVNYRVLDPATMLFTTAAAVADVTAFDTAHAVAAGNGAGWLLVWDEITSTASFNVRASQIAASGAPVGAAYTVSTGACNIYWGVEFIGGWPAIGYSSTTSQYVVMWHVYVSAYDSDSVRARPITIGNVVGTEQTVIAASPSLDATWVSIARKLGSEQYLAAVWDSWDPGAIRAYRFAISATNAATRAVVLSATEAAPGTINTISLTVQAQDDMGNPTPTAAAYTAMLLMTGRATGPATITIPANSISATVTLTDTVAEVVAITLSETTSTNLAEVNGTATFIPGPATRVRVMNNREPGNNVANASMPVTIQVEDANGNRQPIHPAYSANVTDNDALCSLNPTAISIPDGVSFVTITATETGNSNHTSTVTLTETSVPNSGLAESTGQLRWGRATTATKAVVLSATEVAPGTANTAAVRVQIQNAAGSPVTDHSSYTAIVVVGGAATAAATVTIGNGTSTVNLTVNDTLAETVTVDLIETSNTPYAEVSGTATFIAGTATRVRVLSVVEPPPGDTNAATVIVRVEDANGNPQSVHAAYAANVSDNSGTVALSAGSISIPSGTSQVTLTATNNGIAEAATVSLTETSSTTLTETSGTVTFTTAP